MVGSYDGRHPIYLLTTPSALASCDTNQILHLHYLLKHEGSNSLRQAPPAQADSVLRALNIQISRALEDKNMGARALLQQTRMRYLPFESYPALAMACRLSHVHTWFFSVTPGLHHLLSFSCIPPCGLHRPDHICNDHLLAQTPNGFHQPPRLLLPPSVNASNKPLPLGDSPPTVRL